jgi:peptide-methionine (S)-S-oxide reductase
LIRLLIAGIAAAALAVMLVVTPTAAALGKKCEMAVLPPVPKGAEVLVLAGGCFWCMEAPFDEIPGVLATTVGFTGGALQHPTYRKVAAGGTGHREAVRIIYDPAKISAAKLLDIYWRNVDPTDAGGQFCDRGESYKSAIYVTSPAQLSAARASKAALDDSHLLKKPVVTEIADLTTFWPAEKYHQDYYSKNPVRYRIYRTACGRDDRLTALWGVQKTALNNTAH